MSIHERMSRYKTVGSGKGLVRVEVLVPPEAKSAIIEEAARIREEHRRRKKESTLQSLYDEARTRYGTRCLWNVPVVFSKPGLRVIVDRLKKNGDMSAWRLAMQIEREIADAS